MKKYHFFSALLAALLLLGLTAPAAAAQPSGESQPAQTGSSAQPADTSQPVQPEASGTPSVAFDAAVSISPPELTCGAAILVDGDNDEVLYDHNAFQRMYPASITKIMTSLVVLDAVSSGIISLDTPVTASQEAVDLPEGSSTAGIQAGEVLSVEELLYCDLLPSGNDACNILAETISGTTQAFADLMNAKAQALGMTNTHFANPHGLHDPQHYTTAYDIYLMAKEAMKHETFRAIVSSAKHTLPATNMSDERTIYSTNALINNWLIQGYTYTKAIGIKTGSTPEAGYCLASAAVDMSGRTLYAVVLNAQVIRKEDGSTTRYQFKESRELLEWGFQNFERISLLDESADLWEVPVTLSDEQDHLVVQPKGSIERTMPTDYDPEKAELVTDLPESVEAPVEAGQKLGTVTLSYNGKTYGTLDLVTVSGAARSESQYRAKVIREYLEQWWVKALIAAGVVLLFFLIILVTVIIPRGRRRRGRGYRYSGRRRRY